MPCFDLMLLCNSLQKFIRVSEMSTSSCISVWYSARFLITTMPFCSAGCFPFRPEAEVYFLVTDRVCFECLATPLLQCSEETTPFPQKDVVCGLRWYALTIRPFISYRKKDVENDQGRLWENVSGFWATEFKIMLSN